MARIFSEWCSAVSRGRKPVPGGVTNVSRGLERMRPWKSTIPTPILLALPSMPSTNLPSNCSIGNYLQSITLSNIITASFLIIHQPIIPQQPRKPSRPVCFPITLAGDFSSPNNLQSSYLSPLIADLPFFLKQSKLSFVGWILYLY